MRPINALPQFDSEWDYMTTKQDISRWFDRGTEDGAQYLIVACDTYDWSDYPVFVSKEEFDDKYKELDGKNMQKIMEVYDLSKDKDEQLNMHRCFNRP